MTAKSIKVTLTFDDRTLTMEGPEDFVRAEVQRLTNSVANVGQASPSAAPVRRNTSALNERELIAEKRPKNHSETVAVLGFCLTENGTPEFTEADMKKAYLRAGSRPPKVIAQALRDAKNNFDLLESGSTRGSYRLSPHGDRTVRFDLPVTDGPR